jgi:hypothetical protein
MVAPKGPPMLWIAPVTLPVRDHGRIGAGIGEQARQQEEQQRRQYHQGQFAPQLLPSIVVGAGLFLGIACHRRDQPRIRAWEAPYRRQAIT